MTGLGPRLRKLEARQPVRCPTCRRWDGMVLQDESGARTRPERCPECGRLVPVWVRVCLVGVPIDAL